MSTLGELFSVLMVRCKCLLPSPDPSQLFFRHLNLTSINHTQTLSLTHTVIATNRMGGQVNNAHLTALGKRQRNRGEKSRKRCVGESALIAYITHAWSVIMRIKCHDLTCGPVPHRNICIFLEITYNTCICNDNYIAQEGIEMEGKCGLCLKNICHVLCNTFFLCTAKNNTWVYQIYMQTHNANFGTCSEIQVCDLYKCCCFCDLVAYTNAIQHFTNGYINILCLCIICNVYIYNVTLSTLSAYGKNTQMQCCQS